MAETHAECVICFEPLCAAPAAVFVDQRQKRTCSHFFHKLCAEEVARNHGDCPMCRAGFSATREVPDIERCNILANRPCLVCF